MSDCYDSFWSPTTVELFHRLYTIHNEEAEIMLPLFKSSLQLYVSTNWRRLPGTHASAMRHLKASVTRQYYRGMVLTHRPNKVVYCNKSAYYYLREISKPWNAQGSVHSVVYSKVCMKRPTTLFVIMTMVRRSKMKKNLRHCVFRFVILLCHAIFIITNLLTTPTIIGSTTRFTCRLPEASLNKWNSHLLQDKAFSFARSTTLSQAAPCTDTPHTHTRWQRYTRSLEQCIHSYCLIA